MTVMPLKWVLGRDKFNIRDKKNLAFFNFIFQQIS